ncbi:ATP-binding protein [Streptomonospora sp. S1-112]|uniref:ATP-binding protein n=1 Tax=Streptomonospora mangrovi TaxID=2883123 RepID=A0A9X3SDS6_9ACTN|nr:ATP-binding protein [Streptomonospora mangrovi]MDA0565183.1 ATP-binding protein [Streptomonospora mangrovi]
MNDTTDVLMHWARLPVEGAAQARALIGCWLEQHGFDQVKRADANVIVSELVTNAWRHGRSPVTVRASTPLPRCALIEVHDCGVRAPVLPAFPAIEAAGSPEEGGRGLHLVTVLAGGCCGVVPRGGAMGKAVWFALSPTAVPSFTAMSAQVRLRLQRERLVLGM